MAEALSAPIRSSTRSVRLMSLVGDYIALTKPRIIELLLVTTVPVMMLAAHGTPSLGLVLATLV
ncbi:MAG: heme o synthase, partial [Actinomycetota bacterium]|nr:heme o synthase [Actinomycetota bacterium]